MGWINLSTRPIYCDILEESFNFCIERKGLRLFANCIMPSPGQERHMHLIGSSEKRFSELLRDLKSHTVRRFIHEAENNPQESRSDWLLHVFKYHAKYKASNETYQVWIHNNRPIDFTSNPQWYDQKMQYIYDNPVKARMVDVAEDYVRCSFYPLCPVKIES
ncbi:MAG: transposase [Tunicatimonas sp.]